MTLLVWLACRSSPTPAEVEPDPPPAPRTLVDLDDPSSCAACHQAVAAEWEQSMHAHSHAERDPIYGAIRSLRMAKQGDAVGAQCPVCHDPRAPDAPDSPAGRAGVSCAACHAVAEVHRDRGPGARALVMGEVVRGTHDLPPDVSPVHVTGPAAPHLVDGTTLCLACHDATATPTGADACTTGPEYAEGNGTDTCVSCHMPEAEGPHGAVGDRPTHRSHRFFGPHAALAGDNTFLATAIDLQLEVQGDEIVVSLRNLAGHAFPTGFPGRVAQVVVRGTSADGAPWTSAPDTPGTRLGKVYVDADGNPVPAPFSVALAEDTRLRPGELRAVRIPRPTGVDTLAAEVQLRLVAPPLAKALQLEGSPLADPLLVRTTAP